MGRTKGLRLRSYQMGDEARFTPREASALEIAVNRWDWTGGPPPGRCWAIERAGGEVVGLGGLEDIGDTWWSAWALLADVRPREILEALRLAETVIRYMEVTAKSGDEAQICARAKGAGAMRCLERLGFAGVGVERHVDLGCFQVMVRG